MSPGSPWFPMLEFHMALRPPHPPPQVILPLETPIKPSGHLQILYGNLSPQGAGEWGPRHCWAPAWRCPAPPCSGACDPVADRAAPPALPSLGSWQDHWQGGPAV